MTSEIEAMYEDFLKRLKEKLGPIDVNLATRLMYLERKMAKSLQPSVKPTVALTCTYKPNINLENKQYELRAKGSMVESIDEPNTLLCIAQMNMDDVINLSSDSDLEKRITRSIMKLNQENQYRIKIIKKDSHV